MSARAHAAKRVRALMALVQRRSGTISSSASLASRAAPDPENGPRYAHASPSPALVHDLQSRERLRGIQLQVGEPAPGLAAPVVLGLVPPDQPRLEHESLELASRGLLSLDPADLAEEILDLLPPVTVEVGLHPRAKVARLPDVEHAIVPSDEAVHAGRVGEGIREPDLAEMGPSSRADRLAEVAEREDPEASSRGRGARRGPRRTPSRRPAPDGSASPGCGSTTRGSADGRWARRATRPAAPASPCRRAGPRGRG